MNLHPDMLVNGAESAGLVTVFSATQDSNHSFFLVEKLSVPGGNTTSGYVGTLCGLFCMKPGKHEWAVNA